MADSLSWLRLAALCVLTGGIAGCPQYSDPTVPNEILERAEPITGEKYLLYVPSIYDAERAHPLLVACHGTRPFDYPTRQIKDWVKLSEEFGFLVVAPFLEGTSANVFRKVEDQIELQRHDEQHILNVVRHVRGGYNISEDRIFITGWSAGNYAVLYTGLRHPHLFRAVAVLQGNFNASYFTDVVNSIDPHQPVLVLYGTEDLLMQRDGKRCAAWLEDHGVLLVDSEISGGHQGHPSDACDFFRRVVRTVPWLHIRAIESPGDPFTVTFKIRGSFEPVAYRWSFGDGATSPVATPVHTYAATGTYRVALDAKPPKGDAVRRTVDVNVDGR